MGIGLYIAVAALLALSVSLFLGLRLARALNTKFALLDRERQLSRLQALMTAASVLAMACAGMVMALAYSKARDTAGTPHAGAATAEPQLPPTESALPPRAVEPAPAPAPPAAPEPKARAPEPATERRPTPEPKARVPEPATQQRSTPEPKPQTDAGSVSTLPAEVPAPKDEAQAVETKDGATPVPNGWRPGRIASSGEVTLRAWPNGRALSQLQPGESIETAGKVREAGDHVWEEVRLPDGRQGWVVQRFVRAD